VRRTPLFTQVAYEVRLNVYSVSDDLLFSNFCVSLKMVDCKHSMCIITSKISNFNFGYLSNGPYIYVSEDMRICGYFSKSNGPWVKPFGNNLDRPPEVPDKWHTDAYEFIWLGDFLFPKTWLLHQNCFGHCVKYSIYIA
jgi:hypothetical protein